MATSARIIAVVSGRGIQKIPGFHLHRCVKIKRRTVDTLLDYRDFFRLQPGYKLLYFALTAQRTTQSNVTSEHDTPATIKAVYSLSCHMPAPLVQLHVGNLAAAKCILG